MSSSLPNLNMSKDEARSHLEERLSVLKSIEQIPVEKNTVTNISLKFKNWDDFIILLLRKIFTNDIFIKKFEDLSKELFEGEESTVNSIGISSYKSWTKQHLLSRKSAIESILERLVLIDEVSPPKISPSSQPSISTTGKDIFIVHGHDNEAKQETARFIEKLNLNAVILHERPNKGRTIIEKLVAESKNAGYAIILLTPDDVGFVKGNEEQIEERARQNVVLELGYFVGKLSREKVCLLLKGNTIIPNDFSGVVYVTMDDAGKWKYDLAKEMQEAGFSIDLNLIS